MLDVIDLLGAGGIGCKGQTVRVKIPSSELRVSVASVETQYDFIGCKMVHTGSGVPSTASLDNDGDLHTRLVF